MKINDGDKVNITLTGNSMARPMQHGLTLECLHQVEQFSYSSETAFKWKSVTTALRIQNIRLYAGQRTAQTRSPAPVGFSTLFSVTPLVSACRAPLSRLIRKWPSQNSFRSEFSSIRLKFRVHWKVREPLKKPPSPLVWSLVVTIKADALAEFLRPYLLPPSVGIYLVSL